MYCYNCGKQIDDKAVVCVGCGVPVTPVAKAKISRAKLNNNQIYSLLLALSSVLLTVPFGVLSGIFYEALFLIGLVLPLFICLYGLVISRKEQYFWGTAANFFALGTVLLVGGIIGIIIAVATSYSY